MAQQLKLDSAQAEKFIQRYVATRTGFRTTTILAAMAKRGIHRKRTFIRTTLLKLGYRYTYKGWTNLLVDATY